MSYRTDDIIVNLESIYALESLRKYIGIQTFIRSDIDRGPAGYDEFVQMPELGPAGSAESMQPIGKREPVPGGNKRSE